MNTSLFAFTAILVGYYIILLTQKLCLCPSSILYTSTFLCFSVSDLLIALIGIPMDFAAAYQFGWKMGEIPCIFLGFVLTFLGKKMCFSFGV